MSDDKSGDEALGVDKQKRQQSYKILNRFNLVFGIPKRFVAIGFAVAGVGIVLHGMIGLFIYGGIYFLVMKILHEDDPYALISIQNSLGLPSKFRVGVVHKRGLKIMEKKRS
jgi:type IV secretory pathway VirB3-like protein